MSSAHVHVLTLNLFVGAPVPGLCGTTPALLTSPRLQHQVDAIAALRPDVVCLQEAYSAALVHELQRRLGDDFRFCFHPVSLARQLVNAFFAMLVVGAMPAVLLWAARPAAPEGLLACAVNPVFLLLEVAAILALWHLVRHSALAAFCLGTPVGGLAIGWRVAAGDLLVATTTPFPSQAGDVLNWLRPRGVQVATFSWRGEGTTNSPVPPATLRIINTHLNRTPSRAQTAQAHHVVKVALAPPQQLPTAAPVFAIVAGDFNAGPQTPTVRTVVELGGLFDPFGPGFATWDAANPLTAGADRAPTHRCDYLFLGGWAQARTPASPQPHLHPHLHLHLHLHVCVANRLLVGTRPPWLSDHFGVAAHIQWRWQRQPAQPAQPTQSRSGQCQLCKRA